MPKPRLSKELYRRGLTPHQFEGFLSEGFQSGSRIRAFRDLLGMRPERFANALGIPLELLEQLEESDEPPSPKFARRLAKAAEEPGKFFQMD